MKTHSYEAQSRAATLRLTTHNLSRQKYYRKWTGIITRCYNPKAKDFHNYGGRGIVVCDEWRRGPAEFIAWCVSQEPIPEGFTLDRYPDMNGPYSPSNCRFASLAQQRRNTRSNVWIEHEGELLVFKDFVKKYGVVKYEIANHRALRGWDRKRAALTPLFPVGGYHRYG